MIDKKTFIIYALTVVVDGSNEVLSVRISVNPQSDGSEPDDVWPPSPFSAEISA